MSEKKETAKKQEVPSPNAWVTRFDIETQFHPFCVSVEGEMSTFGKIQDGDGFLICDGRTGNAIAVARLYRTRSAIAETTFYFDGLTVFEKSMSAAELSVVIPKVSPAVVRLDWDVFSKACKAATGTEFADISTMMGNTLEEQAYIRELLRVATIDDLLGPANGPEEEIVDMSVRDRYLVGRLAPRSTPIDGEQNEELTGTAGSVDTEESGGAEKDASKNRSLIPSSVGLTFCVDGDVKEIELDVSWGRYTRRASEEQIDAKTGNPLRAWKRIPSGGRRTIGLKDGPIDPFTMDAGCEKVLLQGQVRPPTDKGDRLVTLFLVNDQELPPHNQDEAWVFQPEIVVRHPEGRSVFRKKPVFEPGGPDAERDALEMIYRKRVEFSVGHGISVRATTSEEDVERAVEVGTIVMPEYEVQVTETPGLDSKDRSAMKRMVEEGLLDMTKLADMSKDDLVLTLKIISDDYVKWIDEQNGRIGTDLKGHDISAAMTIERCRTVSGRLIEGIETLKTNDDALESFRFANRSMAMQRVRSIYALRRRRKEVLDIASVDVPNNRSWRPFQLAFILLSIPSLADPGHKDRTEPIAAYADLLWFPTGGGKTEAYLGVAAFTMAMRRRQGNLGGLDSSRGLSVIMRYTLRLLTLQQFQRASALICAMEVIRRADPKKWGKTPFTIGLWVGQKVTPNTTKESNEVVSAIRQGNFRGGKGSPVQLTSCPWCGVEIQPNRDVEVSTGVRGDGSTIVYCGDPIGECDFGRAKSPKKGLPVVVVDEELYHRPPSILIATVDKFALMAWRGDIRTFFGKATRECPRHGLLWPEAACSGNHTAIAGMEKTTVKEIAPLRPPDLIIQDEFHLISGPLGTMVGLYETAVDELSTWEFDGKKVRPKVIASTATVRKADVQVKNVFLRSVAVFPPHGLDVEDNFFSIQRPIAEKPGRLYLGVCSPGNSRPAVLIRVYVALLTAAQALFEKFGSAADPYMTLVGYFNSLRELGGMRRLAEDDVQTRAYRVTMSRVSRPGLVQRSVKNVDELTSRVPSRDIPKKLDQLEVKFKKAWVKGETQALDIVLATNMLSVGVDINRLGTMVVNGQPKNTAEYIQATSRVGRFFPGLIVTVLTWSRPRDLSHYETFEHYHGTFYKHVEAQSVTPFSPRALDRGMTGTMVSLLRLGEETFNPNTGAAELKSTNMPEVQATRDETKNRAWRVTDRNDLMTLAESMAEERFDRWAKEASRPGRNIGYDRGQEVAPLLRRPSSAPWDIFTVPMSMREVEPGVRLVMETGEIEEGPAWKVMTKSDEEVKS